jgi:hypothetical protein
MPSLKNAPRTCPRLINIHVYAAERSVKSRADPVPTLTTEPIPGTDCHCKETLYFLDKNADPLQLSPL